MSEVTTNREKLTSEITEVLKSGSFTQKQIAEKLQKSGPGINQALRKMIETNICKREKQTSSPTESGKKAKSIFVYSLS
jgi:predicted transcriptional regulator